MSVPRGTGQGREEWRDSSSMGGTKEICNYLNTRVYGVGSRRLSNWGTRDTDRRRMRWRYRGSMGGTKEICNYLNTRVYGVGSRR